MKVWELMQALAKAPAGADVVLAAPNSGHSPVTGASLYDTDLFQIEIDDLELLDDDGETLGWLSGLREETINSQG